MSGTGPKVSREYLAKGVSRRQDVHIPADGRPMPGYQLALAEIKARGDDNVSSISMASAGETEPMADSAGVKKFFAKFFGKKDESGDDEEAQITTVASSPVQVSAPGADRVRRSRAAERPAHAVGRRGRREYGSHGRCSAATPAAECHDRGGSQGSRYKSPRSTTTRPLPAAITGERQEGLALGYAPDSVFSPRGDFRGADTGHADPRAAPRFRSGARDDREHPCAKAGQRRILRRCSARTRKPLR